MYKDEGNRALAFKGIHKSTIFNEAIGTVTYIIEEKMYKDEGNRALVFKSIHKRTLVVQGSSNLSQNLKFCFTSNSILLMDNLWGCQQS